MVDDSHATGFVGARGRGTHELRGVIDRVDILTGTLGKALGGASGGYTSGRKEIIAWLRQRSRPYLFSNSIPPFIAAATLRVLDMLEADTTLRNRLWENAAHFRKGMTAAGFNLVPGEHPIIPVMLGDAKLASDFARRLLDEGVYVIGFSYPSCRKARPGSARKCRRPIRASSSIVPSPPSPRSAKNSASSRIARLMHALVKPVPPPASTCRTSPSRCPAKRRPDPRQARRHLRHRHAHLQLGCLGAEDDPGTDGDRHEYCGEVVEIGSEVSGFKPGDRVSGEGHITCGYCRNCRAGRRHLCRNTVGVGVNRPGRSPSTS
jgi:hypothetical protein